MEDLMDIFSGYSDFAATEEENHEAKRQEQIDQMMDDVDLPPDLDEASPADLTDDELIELQLAKESSHDWRKHLK